MTQGNATLIIDFGNSETRGVVLFGKNSQTGRHNEKVFRLSNRFAEVPANFIPSSDYNDETSTILHCQAVVAGAAVDGTYANGEVQLKEFDTSPLRPSAIEKKYNSLTTALSFELAMLHAYRAVARMCSASSIQSLDITWTIVALLPPGDFEYGKDKYIKLIESVNRVHTTYPECDIQIKRNKVSVLPEGFCAFIGCVFDKGHTIRPDAEYLIEETTLVLDIGAGTSDIMVIKDNKTINTTMYTINTGGNNVLQGVRKRLRVDGIVLSETDIAEGITTGFVRDGAKTVDIVDYINEAKADTANKLVTDVKNFLEETQYPIRGIGRVLVCGGGAIEASDGKIKALSEEVVSFLKKLSPNVELVDIPTRTVQKFKEDGTPYKTTDKISPRELNIIGASILAELI